MAPISIVKPISPLAINRARRRARMICPRSSCLALHVEHLSLSPVLPFALSLSVVLEGVLLSWSLTALSDWIYYFMCCSCCCVIIVCRVPFFTGGITRALQETQPPQQTQQPCGEQVCVKST